MLGTTQEYLIKNADYKSSFNGSLVQWQVYSGKENRLYTKMANAESALWNDGSINPDEVISSQINKGVIEIVGYKCDELILTCKTGVQKYYYNSAIGIDPKLYEKHKFGNWYDVLSRTFSLPLKITMDNAQFYLEGIAANITKETIDPQNLALPPGTTTSKMQ